MDGKRTEQWQRGVLELCVLALLRGGRLHGYALAQRLSAAGLGTIKGGTLYPLLARLERDALVEITWEPGEPGRPSRKYYTLTDTGRTRLRDDITAWQTWTTRVRDVLTDSTDATGGQR